MKLQLRPPTDDATKDEWDRYYRIQRLFNFEFTLDDAWMFYKRAQERKADPEKTILEIREERGLPIT